MLNEPKTKKCLIRIYLMVRAVEQPPPTPLLHPKASLNFNLQLINEDTTYYILYRFGKAPGEDKIIVELLKEA